HVPQCLLCFAALIVSRVHLVCFIILDTFQQPITALTYGGTGSLRCARCISWDDDRFHDYRQFAWKLESSLRTFGARALARIHTHRSCLSFFPFCCRERDGVRYGKICRTGQRSILEENA